MQEAYDEAITKLADENPGLASEEFVEASQPYFDRIESAYGHDFAYHPQTISWVFRELGGSEVWDTAPSPEEQQIADAFGGRAVRKHDGSVEVVVPESKINPFGF